MNTEKIAPTAAVSDEDLEKVAGGDIVHNSPTDTKQFFALAPFIDDSTNPRYLCPNCKRPVHYGNWMRYYCDPCDASWFDEDKLLLNPNFKEE